MVFSDYDKNNAQNSVVFSDTSDATKTEPCFLGIDEAGRGPVLGPMVYGTCYSPISQIQKLKDMGFADSKTLTEEQREALFEKIQSSVDMIGWIVDILSPTCISNSMLRRSKYNLNALSHDTAIGLIQKALDRGAHITEVYVDTVGDPAKYQAKLKGIFPQLDITVAKKADATYPIVSAASICAKVARDRTLKNWHFPENIEIKEYGSGYPADPVTKRFMADNIDPVFGYPGIVRFSWSTASTLLDSKAAQVHWEDDDEDGKDDKKGSASLLTFFKPNKSDRKRKRHSFFNERNIRYVKNF